MAQLVKRLTLGFGLGHDLQVCEFESHVGLHTDIAWSLLGILSPLLSLPLFLSFSQNK